jgi:hypothetical protein
MGEPERQEHLLYAQVALLVLPCLVIRALGVANFCRGCIVARGKVVKHNA